MNNAQNSYLGKLIIAIGGLVNTAIPIAGGLAFLFFLWGLAVFLFKAGDEKSIEAGKNKMIWGVIALFVIFCVWGIVQLLGTIVGTQTYDFRPAPTCGTADTPLCDF